MAILSVDLFTISFVVHSSILSTPASLEQLSERVIAAASEKVPVRLIDPKYRIQHLLLCKSLQFCDSLNVVNFVPANSSIPSAVTFEIIDDNGLMHSHHPSMRQEADPE